MARKEKRHPHPEPGECDTGQPQKPEKDDKPAPGVTDNPHPKVQPQVPPPPAKPSCPEGYPA